MRRRSGSNTPSIPACTNPRHHSAAWAIYVHIALIIGMFVVLYINLPAGTECQPFRYNDSVLGVPEHHDNGWIWHKFVVVTDLDHDSKHGSKKHTWQAFLKQGILKINQDVGQASVEWDDSSDVALYSQIAAGGRSMELSDLVVFDGHLLTVDDRTGIIYRINGLKEVIPWVLLNDGPGNVTKGFKAEWMTVKEKRLVVGGLGKEWTTGSGEFVNFHPMFVKSVSPLGEVQHIDWVREYKTLRKSVGISWPGYMIHESGQWSDVHKKWFFMPRRASTEGYSEDRDESMGTDLLLISDENFQNVKVKHIGQRGDGARGFSAFQFVPGTNDELIVALKSEERNGKPVGSYLIVFRWSDGRILLSESKLHGDHKFEGIAFV